MQLKIFVYPSDSKILINGEKYNPNKRYKKGNYQIDISAKGYESKHLNLNLDKSKTVEVTLKRDWFKLTVIPNPLDSKIELLDYNKKYQKGMLLKKNKYQLKISAKNHKTKIVEVDLQKDLIVKVKLEQTKFRLQINTIPEDAKVEFSSGVKYYDGIYLNQGNYQIRVFSDGYKTKTIDLNLKADTTLNIDLTEARNEFETIYSWTGEEITDFNLPEYKYPKATFQEFLNQLRNKLLAEEIEPFKFEKTLKPKDEFETTAEFEQRKLDYQLELEQAKIKYQNQKTKKLEEINQELNQKKDEVFCYWFDLGETQKLELKYNADKEYFNTSILINNIPIKFNFPVPREQAKDFKMILNLST